MRTDKILFYGLGTVSACAAAAILYGLLAHNAALSWQIDSFALLMAAFAVLGAVLGWAFRGFGIVYLPLTALALGWYFYPHADPRVTSTFGRLLAMVGAVLLILLPGGILGLCGWGLGWYLRHKLTDPAGAEE